jgi:hypothetical protein
MRAASIGLGALLSVIMFSGGMASANTASGETPVLSHRQVLRIALGKAAQSKDPHPKRIEMATGSLRDAISVSEPTGGLGSGAYGEELVDLVVMHGYFHIIGSPPLGHSIAPNKVLELIIDAHNGSIEGLSLGSKVPVPLSHLGPVTRLD